MISNIMPVLLICKNQILIIKFNNFPKLGNPFGADAVRNSTSKSFYFGKRKKYLDGKNLE